MSIPPPVSIGSALTREDWAFSELTFAETHRGTHVYHSYPMRFVPQFAEALIRTYSQPGDTICDPFMGSGTTLVEAALLGRLTVGVDANPLSRLIVEAKVTALNPATLASLLNQLERMLDSTESTLVPKQLPEDVEQRLLYWHPRDNFVQLGRTLSHIEQTPGEDARRFFLCGFSQVLKQCSYWWSGSTRPIRSLKRRRVPAEPKAALLRQLNLMMERNRELWTRQGGRSLSARVRALVGDARILPLPNESVDAIITSPPYVTSYDYAELHQLSLLWLGYVRSYQDLRGSLIGTQFGVRDSISLEDLRTTSPIAFGIATALSRASSHKFLNRAVTAYFRDMWKAAGEMARVLRPGGRAVLVIGNTRLRDVEMRNAECLSEMMSNQGFRLTEAYRRPIPVKSIPRTRNPINGQFTSGGGRDPYAEEYVLVFSK